MPARDRYAVDVAVGRRLMIRPGNMKIVQNVENGKSEWIAWNPPEKVVECARESVCSINVMTSERDRRQADADRLRAASISMFQGV